MKMSDQKHPDLDRLAKLEKLRLLEAKESLRVGLPHLYGFPWYKWAREFFESTNKINLLCAGNQISKSSTQIRKCIDWSTNTKLWPRLWRRSPRQFWYMYPSQKQVKIEYETKWSEFLPSGEYKNHPQYGWKPEMKNGELIAIKFNSGVNVYFKTYTQDATVLQSATVDAIFADEEMPEGLYPELMMRLTASNGYYHMVFTATLGQDFWRRVIEPEEHEEELLPEASKWQVGMYDCQVYDDGTYTHWTNEYIQMIINRCGTQEEILRRVFGRFIRPNDGKKYPQFNLKSHMRTPLPVPEDWHIFEGVDAGSGSTKDRPEGHPAAICFVAVNPSFTAGRVFHGWRGDNQKSTAGDIYLKHLELKKSLRKDTYLQFYDGAAADFKTISDNYGDSFIQAEKSHEIGEQIINTLFKNGMMTIDDTPELRKLGLELSALRKDTPKNKAKDDFADAFRYAITKVPWDWSVIQGDKPSSINLDGGVVVAKPPETEAERNLRERREMFFPKERGDEDVGKEMEAWNELYG